MAGTIPLNTVSGYVQYINTKATLAKEKVRPTADIEAYTNGDGKTIILPYEWTPRKAIVMPAFESDGTTASVKTFRFLNAQRLPLTVTYSGNATA